MAKRITYGVNGMIEWVALIKAGKTTIKVPFSGGSLTAYGVTPAEFTTDNAVYQAAIERSEYYRDGRIVKLAEYPLQTVEDVEAVDVTNEVAEEAKVELQEIAVSDLAAAKAYLMENYSVAANKLTSLNKIKTVAATYGIEFKIG